MNKEIYTTNSDNSQQQKTDGSNAACSKCCWSSIYNNFHPVRRLPSITICMIVSAFLFFTGYSNSRSTGKPITTPVKTIATQYNEINDLFSFKMNGSIIDQIKEENMNQGLQIILSNN